MKMLFQHVTILFFTGSLILTASAEEKNRIITVQLSAPDMGWNIAIQEVYQVKNELWVLSKLSRHPGMAAQMISVVSDSLEIDAPDLPIQHYVLGKTWGWENNEVCTFINDRKDLEEQLAAAIKLYDKEEFERQKMEPRMDTNSHE